MPPRRVVRGARRVGRFFLHLLRGPRTDAVRTGAGAVLAGAGAVLAGARRARPRGIRSRVDGARDDRAAPTRLR
jgi:hypothetical protein